MKKLLVSTIAGVAFAGAAMIGAAGDASADHVNVKKPGPPWSKSRDGLTYCYIQECLNFDKTGRYVCTTDSPAALICDAIMVYVRAVPPANIGDTIPHHLIP